MPSMRKWINEMPGALMAPAALAALVTYRGAMKPPGGFWKDGQPVMLTKFPASYAWFRVLNSMTFYTSLVIILLISSHRLYGTPPARMTTTLALFDLLCFVATFFFASSPGDPFGHFAACLLAVVLVCGLVCVLVYSGVAIGKRFVCTGQYGDAPTRNDGCPPQIKP